MHILAAVLCTFYLPNRVVLIRRPAAGSNENTELERFELENLKHIPRVGDKLFWDGRDYTVIEVTWDLQGDSVTIGAEF
jgi:hypothetical protein